MKSGVLLTLYDSLRIWFFLDFRCQTQIININHYNLLISVYVMKASIISSGVYKTPLLHVSPIYQRNAHILSYLIFVTT